jgi:hypothetical protein
LKSCLLGIVFLSACRQVEPRITEARIEAKEPDEVVIRFRLDCDVRHLGNSQSLGYVTVPGQLPSEADAKWARWHATTPLQEIPGERTAGTVPYLCQIPLKADHPGRYDYIGIDGKRGSLWVEHPYDLSRLGEVSLELQILGGGCGLFVTGVMSDVVTLPYRRP